LLWALVQVKPEYAQKKAELQKANGELLRLGVPL
jgi:hypothetical protein